MASGGGDGLGNVTRPAPYARTAYRQHAPTTAHRMFFFYILIRSFNHLPIVRSFCRSVLNFRPCDREKRFVKCVRRTRPRIVMCGVRTRPNERRVARHTALFRSRSLCSPVSPVRGSEHASSGRREQTEKPAKGRRQRQRFASHIIHYEFSTVRVGKTNDAYHRRAHLVAPPDSHPTK